MSRLNKLKTLLKLKLCEVVDLSLLPVYFRNRATLFKELGIPQPGTQTTKTELSEELLVNPQTAAWEQLFAHLATTLWTQNKTSEFERSEFIVVGLGAKVSEEGRSQIMITLRDRFSGHQQPIPLSLLLHNFEPVGEVKPQEYH